MYLEFSRMPGESYSGDVPLVELYVARVYSNDR